MKRTLLNHVPSFQVLMEWYPLEKEAEKIIGSRAVNFYCYAISTENECLICSMFFKKIITDLGIDFNTFEFTDDEQLLIDYGRAIVKDPEHVPEEIFEELKKRYSSEEIVAITAFGTIMIATNLVNKILHVDLDDHLYAYTDR